MRKPFSARSRADCVRPVVTRGLSRKYYRIPRGGRWYGGVATADCSGCNLKCVFCWSDKPRDHIERIGRFHSPEEVFHRLSDCAAKHGYELLRLSGNEPTSGTRLPPPGRGTAMGRSGSKARPAQEAPPQQEEGNVSQQDHQADRPAGVAVDDLG